MWAIDDPTARGVAQGIDPLMPSVNFDLAPAKAHHAIETANGETPEQYERPSKSGQAAMARGEVFSERNQTTLHLGITIDGIMKFRRPSPTFKHAGAGMTVLFCLTE